MADVKFKYHLKNNVGRRTNYKDERDYRASVDEDELIMLGIRAYLSKRWPKGYCSQIERIPNEDKSE